MISFNFPLVFFTYQFQSPDYSTFSQPMRSFTTNEPHLIYIQTQEGGNAEYEEAILGYNGGNRTVHLRTGARGIIYRALSQEVKNFDNFER